MSYDIVMINMQITMHINISATNTTPTTSQQHSSHTIQLARGHGDKILVGNGNRDIRLIGLGLARERRRRRFQVERPRLDGTRLGLYVKLKDGVDLWVGNGQVEDGKWKIASSPSIYKHAFHWRPCISLAISQGTLGTHSTPAHTPNLLGSVCSQSLVELLKYGRALRHFRRCRCRRGGG